MRDTSTAFGKQQHISGRCFSKQNSFIIFTTHYLELLSFTPDDECSSWVRWYLDCSIACKSNGRWPNFLGADPVTLLCPALCSECGKNYGARESQNVSSTKTEEGFQTSDFGLRTSDFGLQTSDFKLQTSDFGLQTSDFRAPGLIRT